MVLPLGGGYEIVQACDLVVASEKAKLGQPEINVGVFPQVACYILPRLWFPGPGHWNSC